MNRSSWKCVQKCNRLSLVKRRFIQISCIRQFTAFALKRFEEVAVAVFDSDIKMLALI